METTDLRDLEHLTQQTIHPNQLHLPGFAPIRDIAAREEIGAGREGIPRRAAERKPLSRLELMLAAYHGAPGAARPYLRRAMIEVIEAEGVTLRAYVTAYIILGMEEEAPHRS